MNTLKEFSCKLVSPGQRLSDTPVDTLFDAVSFMAEQIHDDYVESIYAILCSPDRKPVGFTLLGKGNENCCVCSPAELLRVCILSQATFVCIIHNHPSSELEQPSELDDNTVRQFSQALDLFNIELLDFLIVNQKMEIYSYVYSQRPPFEDPDLSPEEQEYIEQLTLSQAEHELPLE